jgi:hypothetical protein
MKRKHLLVILAAITLIVLLALLLRPGRAAPMTYAQVVEFARQTGYRPATSWEFMHLNHGQLRRLKKDGYDYPWLFVKVANDGNE